MSSGVDVRRRPGIWSYFSFNSGPRRRTSVSLPRVNTNNSDDDPFEKPDRHRRTNSAGFMTDYKGGVMNQGQRMRYLKTGGIIAFVLLILYFVAPHDAIARVPSPGGGGKGQTAAEGAETSKCERSYSKEKPLIQYALMIDAGSTGSRIHVYKFNNCGPTPELESEVFEMTAKKEGGSGLSSYKADAEGAAQSLDVLMEVAVKNVPPAYQGCTPVAVKATAGLRKLGEAMSDAILKAVRNRLETKFPFPVVAEEKGGVQVMDGKDEGVYAWITANYLLGKIGGPDKSPTAAVLDLGGGSTQIVFEPTFKDSPHGGMPEKLAPGDHKYELDFGGRHFELYQHSYLGYGLMEARNNLHVAVLNSVYEQNKASESKAWLEKPIVNPCIAPRMSKEVQVMLPQGHILGASVSVNMTGPAEGSPALCRSFAEKTLEKDAECKLAPCAFRGVHQPSFEKTFAREDVYLFSYFYDRTQPLGMPESFSLDELKDLTNRVCHGEGAWDVFESVPDAMTELRDRPEWCLDLNFQLALLHTGYEMPINREVKIAKKIKGNELGWCLGASLPLLSQESGWKCKVREVQ
ncbi:guanosine-diphosphatase [Aaosphaeria arxii CBS 175.79]|uniref:guanosine-diphosphatase n=1 Tax=Aaosphaeria arxii CBS 175.79 TaxID=1450172 RepID=A0A6A5XEU8_9PLEO|nr:guanosine-diphosphatase [Aaosphaeria arxii CBS 175.79]KAF2011337.1 guanosine-diphosphatase [Aaosphaeria arxii CBS 175.79]